MSDCVVELLTFYNDLVPRVENPGKIVLRMGKVNRAMDNHVNQLKQIAQHGKLAVVIGATPCNEANLWKILLNELLVLLADDEESWKGYVQEIRERAVLSEVFFRLLYQHIGNRLFPLWKCFIYGKPGKVHRQIAALSKFDAISWIGTTAIDNRLALALKEQNGDQRKVAYINGEIGNEALLRDSLSVSENNFTALGLAGEGFFRSLKQANAILVIGLAPGEYCWQASYGKLATLVKEGKTIYWVAENPPLPVNYLSKIGQMAVVVQDSESLLDIILKEIGGKPSEREDPGMPDFSHIAAWAEENFSLTTRLYFLALLLKAVVSRIHASELFEKLVGIYQQAGDDRQLALCHRYLAQIFLEQGYVEKAIETHNKAMSFWSQTTDELGTALEHILLGDTYWNGASLEQAVQHYGEALSIYRKVRSHKEISDVASKLAYICDEEGDYELSKRYYVESLQAVKMLNNPLGEIVTLLNFSTDLIKDKNWAEAKRYLEESLALSEKEEEDFYLGDVLQYLGLVYMNLEDYPAARRYYEKALQFYKKRGEKISLTFVYCNLGHVCVRLEDYNAAVEYYEGALESYEKMGDWQHLAAVYNNLGFVNSNRQNYPLAEEYFSRAAEIFAALGDVYNLIRTHSNLGRVYCLEGEQENALECYKANIEMLDQLNEQEDLAATLVSLAMVELQCKRFEDALSHLQQALDIYEKLKMKQGKEETRKIIETIKTNILPSAT